jgi:hypothetical protein
MASSSSHPTALRSGFWEIAAVSTAVTTTTLVAPSPPRTDPGRNAAIADVPYEPANADSAASSTGCSPCGPGPGRWPRCGGYNTNSWVVDVHGRDCVLAAQRSATPNPHRCRSCPGQSSAGTAAASGSRCAVIVTTVDTNSQRYPADSRPNLYFGETTERGETCVTHGL